MSLYGEWKAATIDNGQTSSAEVNLGRDYDYAEIQFPTMTSCNVSVTTAEKTAGTFRTLGGSGNSKDIGTGGINDVFVLGGWQFIKVVSSVAQGAERLVRVRGMRY